MSSCCQPSFQTLMGLIAWSAVTSAAAAATLEPEPLWTFEAASEVRPDPPPALAFDAGGWFTHSKEVPARRIGVDAATGATLEPGRAGIPLPLNGGVLLADYRLGDICFNTCFVEHEEIDRQDDAGRPLWSRVLPPSAPFGPAVGASSLHEWPGLIAVASGGVVQALDATTGAVRWVASPAGCVFGSFVGDAVLSLSCGASSGLARLEPDGSLAWRYSAVGSLRGAVALAGGRFALLQSRAGELDWRVISAAGEVLGGMSIGLDPLLLQQPQLRAIGTDQSVIAVSGGAESKVWWLQLGDPSPRWTRSFNASEVRSLELLAGDLSRGQILLQQRLPSRGRVLALAAADGSPRWTYALAVGQQPAPAPKGLSQYGLTGVTLPLAFVDGVSGASSGWVGLDLALGAVRWEHAEIALPVLRESAGFVHDERVYDVQYSASDPQQPRLEIRVLGLDGQLEQLATLALPPRLTREDPQLRLQHNADRILIALERFGGGADEPGWVVVDRQSLAVVALLPRLSHVELADRGHVVLELFEFPSFRRIQFFSGSAAADWTIELPSGSELHAVYADGVLARLGGSPGTAWVGSDGIPRFSMPEAAGGGRIRRTTDGSFAALSDQLRLRSGVDGSVLQTAEIAPLQDAAVLDLESSVLFVSGSADGSYLRRLYRSDDLLPLALLDSRFSSLVIPVAPAGDAPLRGWQQSAVSSVLAGVLEQVELAPGGAPVQIRRNLLLLKPRTEIAGARDTLYVGPDRFVLGQHQSRGHVPALRYAAYGIPRLSGTAALSLTVASAGRDRQPFVLAVSNDGPDATRVRLQAAAPAHAVLLRRLSCDTVAALQACAKTAGDGLPDDFALPAGAVARFTVEPRLLSADYRAAIALEFAVDADAQTNEVERADNHGVLLLSARLFDDGFE